MIHEANNSHSTSYPYSSQDLMLVVLAGNKVFEQLTDLQYIVIVRLSLIDESVSHSAMFFSHNSQILLNRLVVKGLSLPPFFLFCYRFGS